MEPMNCTADVRKGSCEIWAPTPFPSFIQQIVAGITRLPESAVKVHITLMGGGFGRRAAPDFAVEAVEISKAVAAPVQVLLDARGRPAA
jgi:isoquinoline 1-oxidoreductase subunit beta